MKSMFYNYDHNITKDFSPPYIPQLPICEDLASSDTLILRNVLGDVKGVQVRYQIPFTLYFNLEDQSNNACMSLANIVKSSAIEFEILTTTGISVVRKLFSPEEVFNEYTNDLMITLNQADILELKRDVYRVCLKLLWEEAHYTLFGESDGLLVVR